MGQQLVDRRRALHDPETVARLCHSLALDAVTLRDQAAGDGPNRDRVETALAALTAPAPLTS